MIGDHHGWSARRATLLLAALDGILGTHNAPAVLPEGLPFDDLPEPRISSSAANGPHPAAAHATSPWD